MKNFLLFTLLAFGTTLFSQETVYFEEDFETYPLSTFVSIPGGVIASGTSECVRASVGNSSDYNSTNVNFNHAQNSTTFLGVNPESPCGGYYDAKVGYSGLVDFSSATEQVRFTFKYFISSTLGWGNFYTPALSITISDGVNTLNINSDTELTTTDDWTEFSIDIPTSFNDSVTSIELDFGAGEGIAIDDIKIVSGTTLSVKDFLNESSSIVYPNPSKGIFNIKSEANISNIEIYTTTGTMVSKSEGENIQSINLSDLSSGTYILKMKTKNKGYLYNRVVKE